MHVLQLLGDLHQDDQCFFVDHEPAEPIPAEGLYDPARPGSEAAQLLRLAAALFDALRTAHATTPDQPRPTIHGGLCPGAILVTPDGIEKVTDFGFAPAVCSALGVQSYLNLALGPGGGEQVPVRGTGVWQVLEPEEFERNDRLCAYIDPEKYGSRTLESFEPGSDIIAASFILHLLAEHRHPYLYAEPDAHRLVEASEYMAMSRYNGARRQDLRESSEEAVKVWCDLVARMLARLPQNRPPAAELAATLGQHVKPLDPADMLRRRLENAQKLVEQQAWDDLRRRVKPIVDAGGPPDVTEKAVNLLRQADAHLLLQQATAVLKSDDWPSAEKPLAQLLALPALPKDVADRAQKVASILKHNVAVQHQLDEIRQRIGAETGQEPAAVQAAGQAFVTSLDALPPDKTLLPQVRSRLEQVREDLMAWLEKATAALREAMEADHAAARAWMGDLEVAQEAEDWPALEKLLAEKPSLRHWPEGIQERATEIQHVLDKQLAEQRRQAAIEADHRQAEKWFQPLQKAAEAQAWDRVEELLKSEPKLTHWPEGFQAKAKQFAGQLGAYRKEQADFAEARKWCDQLRSAVKSRKWQAAADVLAKKPVLDHWPPEVTEAEPGLRGEVEQQLKAIELERRRREEEERRARQWLEGAETAARAGDWDRALAVLGEAPRVEHLPEEIATRAEQLRSHCTAKREESLRQKRQAEISAVESLASKFVQDLARKEFAGVLDPAAVQTRIDPAPLLSAESLAEGLCDVTVRIGPAPAADKNSIATTLSFRLQPAPSVEDEDGSVRKELTSRLGERLAEVQKTRAAELFAPLRKGVFPKVQVKLRLEGLTRRLPVAVDFLGGEGGDATAQTDIAWDASQLRWSYADPKALGSRASALVLKAARDALAPSLTQRSAILRPYQGTLKLDVTAPADLTPDALTGVLSLQAKLSLQPGKGQAPVPLQTLPIKCAEFGRFDLEGNLAEAEGTLRKLVLTAQNGSRDAIATELKERGAAAGARIKVAADPKKLAAPTDEVAFDISARRHPPLNLTARWDPNAFTYRMTDGWEDALGRLLVAPPEAEAPPKRLLKPIAAVVAALAVVGTGGWYVTTQLGQGPPSVVENENQNGSRLTPPVANENADRSGVTNENSGTAENENRSPVENENHSSVQNENTSAVENENSSGTENENSQSATPPKTDGTDSKPPSIDAAIGKVRQLFLDSKQFRDDDIEKLSLIEPDTSDPQSALVAYRVPGLADPNGEATLEKSADGKTWVLPAAQEQTIRQALAELVGLLKTDATEPVRPFARNAVQNAGYGQFIDPAQVNVRLTTDPKWVLSNAGDAWVAPQTQAAVVFEQPNAPAPIELTSVPLGLEVRDGALTPDPGQAFGQAFNDAIAAKLLDLQRASFRERQEELSKRLADAGPAQVHPSPDTLDTLVPAVEYEATVTGLQPRSFETNWDERSLAFSPTDLSAWNGRIGDTVAASKVIAALNSRANPQQDWLGRGTSGPVLESAAPDASGTWTLASAPPWAASAASGTPPANDDRMTIPVRWPQDPGKPAQEIVGEILGASPPAYWPLLESYSTLKTRPDSASYVLELLKQAPKGRSADGNRVLEQIQSDQAVFVPELALVADKAPRLFGAADAGVLDTLELPISGRWGFRELPPALDPERLRQALQGGASDTELNLMLSLGRDGQVQVAQADQSLAPFAPGLDQLRVLDQRLAALPKRIDTEKFIEGFLKNASEYQLQELESWTVLTSIWTAKNAQPPRTLDSTRKLTDEVRRDSRSLGFKNTEGTLGATVFAEFFCGPTNCYAITWSVGRDNPRSPPAIIGQPQVIRLCSMSEIARAVQAGAGSKGDLGEKLFGPVFAAAAASLSERYEIGLVLALDDPLWLIEGLDGLEFASKEASLRPAFGAQTERSTSWTHLSELRGNAFRSDFVFVRSLVDRTSLDQKNKADRWAIQTLLDATAAGG